MTVSKKHLLAFNASGQALPKMHEKCEFSVIFISI